MNIVKIFNSLIGSILVAILFSLCGSRLFSSKIPRKTNSLLAIISLVLTVFCSFLYLDNALKVISIYIVTLFMHKVLFKKTIIQCAISGLISYLLLTAGEVFISILVSIVIKLNFVTEEALTAVLKGNIIFNLLIVLSSYLLLLLTYRKLRKFVDSSKENKKISYLFAFSILMTSICSLLYKLFSDEYMFNDTFIVHILLIIAIGYIGIIMVKQVYDKSKISDEYERYVNYSKQSEKLVEQYSISQHENKNELIIIRSMVHKTNKKLLEYLDEIITEKDNIDKAWIRYLRYIPFGGLKGIIHNKISEMKENEIKVLLNISSEVGKSQLKSLTMKNNNQLSKIIGIFLDNAREAALSSRKKEVNINIYIENKYIIFEISNTYNGTIDPEKIYEVGHTNKGKGRGYGLTLVKSIVDDSNIFINETKLFGEYFVQILKVNNEK